MAMLSTLVAFTLRQVSLESGEQVVGAVYGWLVDPSRDLQKAIARANAHTWHSLTLALGGDGWLDSARGWFSPSDVRGVRDEIRAFLRSANVGMDGLDGRFRKNCLAELKRLKEQGRLEFDSVDPSLVAQRARGFRRFDEPSGLAREARRAAQQLAGELAKDAPNLSQLLQLPLAGDDRPLLVTAFDFFLRREIVEHPELHNTMMLDGVERLYAEQASGFEVVRSLLGGVGSQLTRIIDVMVIDLDKLLDRMDLTHQAAVETGDNVRALMARLAAMQHELDRHRRDGEDERREMRLLMGQLMRAMQDERQSVAAYVEPNPFAAPAEPRREDREAVEALLGRSPLNARLKRLALDEVDREIERACERQNGRKAGSRMDGPHGMTLVWIPPGSFFMGSSTSEPCRDPDEFPHHATLTSGFWMSAGTRLRAAQWWKVMRAMPDDTPANDHPVEGVSWQEANEFLDVLVEQMEYEFAFRLPTEAEWEYACRAGTVTPFASGFRLSSGQANFDATRYDERLSAPPLERRPGTTPVGTFPPNAWGLYDVHGNVMEWCSDWYGRYEVSEVKDPTGPEDGQARVLRGGGWWSPVHACRSARRSSALPDANTLPAGFRVVLVEPS